MFNQWFSEKAAISFLLDNAISAHRTWNNIWNPKRNTNVKETQCPQQLYIIQSHSLGCNVRNLGDGKYWANFHTCSAVQTDCKPLFKCLLPESILTWSTQWHDPYFHLLSASESFSKKNRTENISNTKMTCSCKGFKIPEKPRHKWLRTFQWSRDWYLTSCIRHKKKQKLSLKNHTFCNMFIYCVD